MGIGQSSQSAAKAIGSMGRLREDMALYRLVDMHGDGDLVKWLRYAEKSGDHSIVDSYMDVKVREFMYTQGRGKLVTITELVKLRNKERNAMLGAFSRKKGKGKSGPNVLDEFNQEGDNVGDLKKALKLLDGGGGGKGGKNESKYREIAWKLEDRGSMGETLMGVCILNGSDIHNKLVLKLIDMFPKLINDINISEDYYGMAPLHQAIVNQDVRLAAILLKHGADVNQRCYGAYFCADDQKAGRTDSLEHEYVELPLESTNYTGNMYFGEYPLSFATCMGHPDCFRLLLAYKANINARDTNGNTALHMCVIHEKLDMLRLCLEKGANYRLMNEQTLTPLTLAAKLAKKRMFAELLEEESDTIWEYGDASRASYPLARIDTINQETGDINDTSALSLAVYGSSKEHLEMLDGLLESLVQKKWDTFAQKQWIKSLVYFTFYYVMLFMSYMNRPFSMTTELETSGDIDGQGNIIQPGEVKDYDDSTSRCHLYQYHTLPWHQGWLRLGCELTTITMVAIQMIEDAADIRRIGWYKWSNIYKAFPAKIIYKASWIFVMLTIPMRMLCSFNRAFIVADNHLSALVVVMSTIHFLFFCRALKFIGPFVLMLYTIIGTDLIRFFLVYFVFLMGFSQSFYMIFYSCEAAVKNEYANSTAAEWDNLISTPQESFLRTFIMTVGEFMTLYRRLEECPKRGTVAMGKIIFLVFELVVRLMQLNLLIGMMTRTYETIRKTTDEYKRQWAKVVLMLEVSLKPADRLRYLYKYSTPTGTNKQQRSFTVDKKVDPKKPSPLEHEKAVKKIEEMSEEKRMLMRRKKMDQEARGIHTSAANTRFATVFKDY